MISFGNRLVVRGRRSALDELVRLVGGWLNWPRRPLGRLVGAPTTGSLDTILKSLEHLGSLHSIFRRSRIEKKMQADYQNFPQLPYCRCIPSFPGTWIERPMGCGWASLLLFSMNNLMRPWSIKISMWINYLRTMTRILYVSKYKV